MIRNSEKTLAFAMAYGISFDEVREVVSKGVLEILWHFNGDPQDAVTLIENYHLSESFLESGELVEAAKHALLNAYLKCDTKNVILLKEKFSV